MEEIDGVLSMVSDNADDSAKVQREPAPGGASPNTGVIMDTHFADAMLLNNTRVLGNTFNKKKEIICDTIYLNSPVWYS